MAIDITKLWDFSDPKISETRFRQAMVEASADDRLILLTQVARSYGLRKEFSEARDILASIEPSISQASAEAQTHYRLELGRTYASPAHSKESRTVENDKKAKDSYMSAFETAKNAHLDTLAIDALHMMPFVASEPESQLKWNLKAIDYMERSSQADAKRWEGSLRNNLGYAKHLSGEYDDALTQFQLSLAAYDRDGKVDAVRIAHWMIAWTLRAQKKYPQAIEIQLRLEREFQDAGNPDPYVFEELVQLYRETGNHKLELHYREKYNASM